MMPENTDETPRKRGTLAGHLRGPAFDGLSVEQQIMKLIGGMSEGVGRVEDLEREIVGLRNQARATKEANTRRMFAVVLAFLVPTLALVFQGGRQVGEIEHLTERVQKLEAAGENVDARLRAIETGLARLCAAVPGCEA